MAREIIRRAPLLFGLGVVENAYDQTAEVVAAWPPDFERPRRDLLQRAKTLMPRLPFDQLDILVVDEMGKEISGCGHGPQRHRPAHGLRRGRAGRPCIIRIVVRDLTDKTYGSAIGVGLADFTTRRSGRQDGPDRLTSTD